MLSFESWFGKLAFRTELEYEIDDESDRSRSVRLTKAQWWRGWASIERLRGKNTHGGESGGCV